MSSQEKVVQALLELGNPAEPGTRTQLLERALRTALLLTDADAVVLATSNRRGERVVLHSGSSLPAVLQTAPDGSQVMRMLAESCQPIALSNLKDEPVLAAADGCPGVESGPVLYTPVRRRTPLPAYLAAYRKVGRAKFSMNDTRMMLLLAAWLTTALEHVRLASGTEKLAVRDDLTNVYNYRYLRTALRRELRRAARFGQELSIIKIDVDHLKAHNESLGELKGNLLLRELASALAQQVRSFDVMARHGEDEFMLILPQTDRDGAAEVAERVRAAVERQAFSPTDAGAVTVSLGVATFPQDAADVRGLAAAADRALQQAKDRGRNCVATLTRRAA
jgi:diguanylate cyclase (GGDEF)-like protein